MDCECGYSFCAEYPTYSACPGGWNENITGNSICCDKTDGVPSGEVCDDPGCGCIYVIDNPYGDGVIYVACYSGSRGACCLPKCEACPAGQTDTSGGCSSGQCCTGYDCIEDLTSQECDDASLNTAICAPHSWQAGSTCANACGGSSSGCDTVDDCPNTQCYECVDGKCQQVTYTSPCPICQKCIDGNCNADSSQDGESCDSSDPCKECQNGSCTQKPDCCLTNADCGVCKRCDDNECVDDNGASCNDCGICNGATCVGDASTPCASPCCKTCGSDGKCIENNKVTGGCKTCDNNGVVVDIMPTPCPVCEKCIQFGDPCNYECKPDPSANHPDACKECENGTEKNKRDGSDCDGHDPSCMNCQGGICTSVQNCSKQNGGDCYKCVADADGKNRCVQIKTFDETCQECSSGNITDKSPAPSGKCWECKGGTKQNKSGTCTPDNPNHNSTCYTCIGGICTLQNKGIDLCYICDNGKVVCRPQFDDPQGCQNSCPGCDGYCKFRESIGGEVVCNNCICPPNIPNCDADDRVCMPIKCPPVNSVTGNPSNGPGAPTIGFPNPTIAGGPPSPPPPSPPPPSPPPPSPPPPSPPPPPPPPPSPPPPPPPPPCKGCGCAGASQCCDSPNPCCGKSTGPPDCCGNTDPCCGVTCAPDGDGCSYTCVNGSCEKSDPCCGVDCCPPPPPSPPPPSPPPPPPPPPPPSPPPQ